MLYFSEGSAEGRGQLVFLNMTYERGQGSCAFKPHRTENTVDVMLPYEYTAEIETKSGCEIH